MSFRLNKEALTDSNPLTLSNFYRLFLQLLRNNTSLPQNTVEEVLLKRGFSLNLLAGFQQALAKKNSPYIFDFPSLANYARSTLKDSVPLVMTVLLPMKVIIQGRTKGPIHLPTFEQATNAAQHSLTVGEVVYINEMDFRMEGGDDSPGLAPGKVVRLKYAFLIRCEDVEFSEYGEPAALLCREVSPEEAESFASVPVIEWVPEEGGIPVPLRLFNHSFNSEEGGSAPVNADLSFNDELNPENEISIHEAIVDASIRQWMPLEGKYFQFGSLGYFVANADGQGGIIFHQTVKLHGAVALNVTSVEDDDGEEVNSEDGASDDDNFATPPTEQEEEVNPEEQPSLVESRVENIPKEEPPAVAPVAAAVEVVVETVTPPPAATEEVRRKPAKRLVHTTAPAPAPVVEEPPVVETQSAPEPEPSIPAVEEVAAVVDASSTGEAVVESVPVDDPAADVTFEAHVAAEPTIDEPTEVPQPEVAVSVEPAEEEPQQSTEPQPEEKTTEEVGEEVKAAVADSVTESEEPPVEAPATSVAAADNEAVESSGVGGGGLKFYTPPEEHSRTHSSDRNTNTSSAAPTTNTVPFADDDENLSVLDRRQLTKQRIEQQKQARLNEASSGGEGGAGAGAAPISPVGNVAGRAEMIRRKSEIESAAKVQQLKDSHTLTSKVSVAEKAFLVTKQAELDNQAKLEQMKADKLAAFLGSNSTDASGDADGNLSLVERTERARLQAEQERQAKLEADKKKNLTGFLQKGSSTAGDVSAKPADWENMTMAQRREEQQKQAELDKQARLKAFLQSPEQGSGGDHAAAAEDALRAEMSPGGTTHKKSIKDRFENAKKLQQQEEEQRLAKIRSNTALSKSQSQEDVGDNLTVNVGATGDTVTPERRLQRGSSVKNMWDQSLSESKAAKAAATTSPMNKTPEISKSGARSSLKDNWAGVLTESKQSEDSRFNSTKKQTISQFQVTKGTGIVKKRIGEWEELFLQIAASAEQLEALLKAARLLSQNNQHQNKTAEEMRELQKKFQEDCKVPEPFIIGSTHIYNTKLLDYPIAAFIKRCLGDIKTKHFSLACGVYGDQTQPPIEVYAAAIKTDEAYPNYYIALTIKCVAGKELDPNAYGVKKITVFAKETNNKVMDIVVDIIPQFGWEQWIAEGGFGSDVLEQFANSPSLQRILNPNSVVEGGYVSVVVGSEGNAVAVSGSSDSVLVGSTTNTAKTTPPSLALPDSVSSDAAAPIPASQAGNNLLSEFDDIPLVADPQDGASAHSSSLHINTSSSTAENTPGGALTTSDSLVVSPSNVSEKSEAAIVMPVKPEELMGVEPDEFRSSEDTVEFGQSSWTIEPTTESAVDTSLTLEEQQQMKNKQKESAEEEEAVVSPEDSGRDSQAEMEGGDVFDGEAQDTSKNANKSFKDIEDDRLSETEPEPDADDDCAEDTNEPFNFGRTLAVASVGVAREFTAAPVKMTDFEKSAHNAGKFSWSGADEVDTLPTAGYTTVYYDLTEVTGVSCCSNLFVVVSKESSQLFTGTMKTTTTSTKYMVHRDKIFQWIRGAALSGWCVKWPMKSQKYGRRTKRFFVLRDNILTYHSTKPADEEQVLRNYSSKNSLVLTEDSTVTMTRHYFLRAMTITTPVDTLWIRFRSFRGNEIKEKRWKEELYKAVQNQTRKKLFMSLPRVESIWFHESANISVISTDAVSYDTGYSKVALFCLHTQEPEHSTDVAPKPRSSFSLTSKATPAPTEKVGIMRRSSKGEYLVCTNKFSVDLAMKGVREQMEVLRTNDSPFLTSNLKCVKLYGDMVLFGGTNGFIGVGVTGRAPAVDDTPARKVVYCISSNDSTVRTDTSPKNSSSSVTAMSVDGTFLGVNPHSKEATIKCFAVAHKSNIFAAADSLGIISLWYLQKTPQEPSPQTKSAGKKGTANQLLSSIKTEFQSSVNLIGMGSSGNHKGQMVVSMQFMPNDTQLIVCTNKRMLILQLNTHGGRTAAFSPSKPFNPDAKLSMSLDSSALLANASGASATTPAATTTAQPTAVYGSYGSMVTNTVATDLKGTATPTPLAGTQYKVVGWAELDRVALGCNGVFAMHVEPVNTVPIEGAAKRTASSEGVTSDGAPAGSIPATVGEVELHRDFKKLVQWKIVEDEPMTNLSPHQSGGGHHKHKTLSKCTVYRFQWSVAMWEAALLKMKYI